jgi:two-component system OmpR family response regulator
LGADDYLTKDISQPHMLARVVALFRRVDALRKPEQQPSEEVLTRGKLSLNMDRMSAQWDSQIVDLTITELWIVHALAKNPGHVKNRQQLMDAANVVLDDNTITSHVKRIRKKFIRLDKTFDAVQTAYGMGYRWDGN